ncbi:ABC transporter ATP-binding protein [Xiamenia xianingshaonis]|uniref:ATP-binding cassette domain-containing protein n=1 Tax=Xiamenia xianingshaonis TaxID=2682776 RepID=A0ABX0IIF4_9ACTN|nr:ABC transporter ATP-binding protein [Xiamenia xianingshaonis]NHM13596.1 ATP-binding cassette domain-containing protein [Xiamenia xianingshaonis]
MTSEDNAAKRRSGHVVISAENVRKSYGGAAGSSDVLDGVSVDVFAGDFTVIMGPSGAGKTTLLNCLSGLESIDAGEVAYEGTSFARLSDRQMSDVRAASFGFVFQSPRLVSNLTLYENILVAGLLSPNLTDRQARDKADALVRALGIESAARHLPNQVSGGEAQRAAVARALVCEPSIVFADEPTGALNQANSEELLDILCESNAAGQTILMVTHDVKAALRATRIVYLRDGSVEGELDIGTYDKAASAAREREIVGWLADQGW